ncbi:hypothetical protein ASF30_09180 [Leifsonia sp. Leaf264]|nr:hypothetical protein ASF30_09180 [Leifsonia sp. Leaf264]
MFLRLHRQFPTSARAAIDLVSIMVGVIVIAIIAGIISASVFAVIPWSQDEKAKADLTAVKDAEAIAKLPAPAGIGKYGTLIELDGTLEDPGTLLIQTDGTGSCYVATSRSESGKNVYWVTDKKPKPKAYAPADDASVNCGTIDLGVQVDDTPGKPTGGSGGPGGGPGGTPVACPTDGVGVTYAREVGGNKGGRDFEAYGGEPPYSGIDPSLDPFKTFYPWLGGAVSTPATGTDVIVCDSDGKNLPVTAGTIRIVNTGVAIWGGPLVISAEGLVAGDGSNKTMRSLFNGGTITLTLDGVPKNTIKFDTAKHFGDDEYPSGDDGTPAGGDVILPPSIIEDPLPSGQVNNYYYERVMADVPVTWELVDGALPTNVELSTEVSDEAVLSGSPTTAGTFTFQLKASTSAGSDTAWFTIDVVPTLAWQVVGPNTEWNWVATNLTGQYVTAYTRSAMYRSSDYGATFTPIAGGLPANTVAAADMSGDGRIQIAFMGTADVYVSEDYGVNWVNRLTTTRACSCDSAYGFVTGAGKIVIHNGTGIIESTDAGRNWTPVATTPGLDDYIGTKSGEASAGYNDEYSYVGTAGSLQQRGQSESGYMFRKIAVNNDGTVLVGIELKVGVTARRLLISKDSGVTWQPIANAPEVKYTDIAISGNGKTIAATATDPWIDGGTFYSQDGGLSWSKVTVGATYSAYTVAISGDGQTIYTGTGNGMSSGSLTRGRVVG